MIRLVERLRQAACASADASPGLRLLLHASAYAHLQAEEGADQLRIARARLTATRRELNLLILRSEQRIAGELLTSDCRVLLDEITGVRDAIPEDGK